VASLVSLHAISDASHLSDPISLKLCMNWRYVLRAFVIYIFRTSCLID
jgi:hypothetical protein